MGHEEEEEEEDDDAPISRAFHQLCSIIIQVLKIPPLPFPIFTFSNSSPPLFAFLFIGISLALILFGTITLLIGFLSMPLVLFFLFLFYFFNILSFFSNFARSLLCLLSPVSSPKHDSAVSDFPGCGCC